MVITVGILGTLVVINFIFLCLLARKIGNLPSIETILGGGYYERLAYHMERLEEEECKQVLGEYINIRGHSDNYYQDGGVIHKFGQYSNYTAPGFRAEVLHPIYTEQGRQCLEEANKIKKGE